MNSRAACSPGSLADSHPRLSGPAPPGGWHADSCGVYHQMTIRSAAAHDAVSEEGNVRKRAGRRLGSASTALVK